MEKTFTIAGTSFFNGVLTYRVANGKLNIRRNMLKHSGHTDIELQDLPKPMTKVQAVAFLAGQGVVAVVPTRATDKTRKSALQIEAERIAATVAKRAATRAANKEAKLAAQAAAEAAAAAGQRKAERAARKAAKQAA